MSNRHPNPPKLKYFRPIFCPKLSNLAILHIVKAQRAYQNIDYIFQNLGVFFKLTNQALKKNRLISLF